MTRSAAPPPSGIRLAGLAGDPKAIEYARRIALTGTSVELHVHPGCPHGFDRISPRADVVRRARADRLRVLSKPA